jgi:uncharacterized membrane protein
MIRQKLLQMVAAATLLSFLPACVGAAQLGAMNSMNRAGASQAQKDKFKKDQTKTVAQGAGFGALLGAGLGAVIGHATGNTGMGALIGTGVGALAGGAAGQAKANQKATHVAAKFDIIAYINSAKARNAAATKKVTSLERQLATLEANIRKAKASGDSKSLTSYKTQLINIQRQADGERQTVNQEIISLNGVKTQARGDARYAEFNTGISNLQGADGNLKRISSRAASLASQID